MRLHGKKTLITGSTSNIGRAIAFAFAAEGAHVIVSGRDRTRGEAVAEEIRAAGASTKGAMETLTRAWASEFGDRGIRVNTISPGVIVTPDWDSAVEHPGETLMLGIPAGSSGHPDAIAAAYLASDDAGFVHGTVIDVDGGRTGVAVVADSRSS
ncbi:SDR family NAD(P)-dependent oxidoreductase [Nocardia jejuensis]|uniref:SDR family NAD(P)-dependent oxidoreductase n=1 Tax=Nocardia jejuensis TaxID=328049 RepID=UPI000A7F311C|nr:SDR family oxidoreductase [Nocardia jejuensis]